MNAELETDYHNKNILQRNILNPECFIVAQYNKALNILNTFQTNGKHNEYLTESLIDQ